MHVEPIEIGNRDSFTLWGINQTMCGKADGTQFLWESFLQNWKSKIASCDLISLQVYPEHYFEAYNPELNFVKWAGFIGNQDVEKPEELNKLIVPGGLYAQFEIPLGTNGFSFFSAVFSQWIPQSGYGISNRPHYEIFDLAYQAKLPGAKERICIPIEPMLAR